MADLSKYFVNQDQGTQGGSGGLAPLDRSFKIKQLQDEAAAAARESERINSPLGQAKLFAGGVVKGLGNAFLKQPARFAASAAAAPIDLVNQAQGKQPFKGDLPLVGKTFQGQAAVDQEKLYDKAYSGEKLGVKDYATALRPFGEVPLAAVESVALGKGFGKARQVMKKSADKAKTKYLVDILSPRESAAKTGDYVAAIKTGRVSEAGLVTGRSVAPDKRTLAIVDELKSVPGIKKGQSVLKTSNAIHSEVGVTAQNMRDAITSRDVQAIVDADDIENLVKETQKQLAKNPYLVGDAEKTSSKILNEFVSRLPTDRPITAIDVLDARQGLDKWISAQKGANIFDPSKENSVSIALRAVRQGANELLASKASDVAVKEMLLRQTRLYDAIDSLAINAAKEGGASKAARVLVPAAKWLGRGVGTAVPLGAGYYYSQAQKALTE